MKNKLEFCGSYIDWLT